MNISSIVTRVLAAALFLSIFMGVSGAHGGYWGSGTSQGGTYYAVVGSNVTGASTMQFPVQVNAFGSSQLDTYTATLFLEGSHNQAVNQTIVSMSGGSGTEFMNYTFSRSGTYYFYTSVSDGQGDIENTSPDTIIVLPGLIAKMTPASASSMQGQTDSLSVNLTDNFLSLPSQGGEPNPQYYIFKVVQTAPNGTATTIAINTSGNSGIAYGQPYHGSYTIPVPAFISAGSYSYKIYAQSTAAGTNASASASISVAAAPTTTTTVAPTTTIPFNTTSSPNTYYVALGSNLSGASTMTFNVTAHNAGANSKDSYLVKLIPAGSPSTVANQTTVRWTGAYTPIAIAYTFKTVGTYPFYVSVTDGASGFTENSANDTVIALKGLISKITPITSATTINQPDTLNLNMTDNFRFLSNLGGEGSTDYFTYRIMQTSPNGTTTMVAANAPTNSRGQPYTGGFMINVGPLGQIGTYSYTAYTYDPYDGTNASATTSISVTSVPVTTTVNTTTTVPPSSSGGGGGGGCGLCIGGSGGGLPPTTVTTTVVTTTIPPTTTVPPTKLQNTTTQTTSNGTVRSTTVTIKSVPGSGLTPPSLTTSMFIVIIALLLIILSLLVILGRRKEAELAMAAAAGGGAAAASAAATNGAYEFKSVVPPLASPYPRKAAKGQKQSLKDAMDSIKYDEEP